MIRSMTGYGRAEAVSDARKLTVEIKSVNNRYLDFNIRMPRRFNFLEAKIREVLKESVLRGKVDVFITCEEYADEAGALKYNEALAGEYIAHMRHMAETFGLSSAITPADIARAPEVFTIGDISTDGEELWEMLLPVLKSASERYNEALEAEGERLKTDVLLKLDHLGGLVEHVIEHEPEIMEAYKKKLTDTLSEILEDRSIDESKIAAECVLYADKISTDEESVLLRSHIRQMKDELGKSGSIGRKLDFLAQEMNREANTTLSKAGDLMTADIGIEMKTDIEKIREQIQNIE